MSEAGARLRGMETLIVDCGSCEVRGVACQDCVISVLLGVPDVTPVLSGEERRVLELFAEGGLLPPLRHVKAI